MSMNPRLLKPTASGFNPRSISGLALWLDASSTDSLFTTDAGPVVAVASPLDIAGCALWLDGADSSAASMTLDGTAVSSWRDKSGNGRDFTASGTARPTLTASGLNGKSVVTFDGSNDQLTNATNVVGFSSVTMFAVVYRQTGTYGGIITSTSADASPALIIENANIAVRGHVNVSLQTGGFTGPAVVCGRVNAGATEIFTDGLVRDSDAVSGSLGSVTTTAIGTYRLAALNYLNGYIAEIIVYPTALTTAQRASVESYLAAKWGISGVHAPATATSDPVGYWGDKSGNGRHAVMSVSANRPLVGTAVANGRRGINFGTAGNSQRLGWLPSSGTQDWREVIAVAVYDRSASTFADVETLFSGYNTNSGTSLGIGLSGEPSNQFTTIYGTFLPEANINALGHVATSLVRPFPTISSPFVAIARATSAVTPVAVAGYVVGNDRQFSPNRNWRGRMSEVIAFERALTDSERNRIVRYLASKYSITLAPQVANADAQDWINRVYANGGTVSSATAAAVNQFCVDIENAPGGSIRDRFFRLNLFCGSFQGAFVPLFRGPSLGGAQFGGTTDTNNAFVGVGTDYAETGATGGLTGNGTSKYLDTGLTTGTIGFSNGHLSVYHSQASGANQTRTWIGARDTNAASNAYLSNGLFSTSAVFGAFSGTSTANFNTGGSQTGAAAGHRLLSRTTATAMNNYYNAVSQASSATDITGSISGLSSTRSLFVAAYNDQGTASQYMNGRIMAYSAGLGLSQLQAEAFYTAMQTFQTALGRNV